MTGFDEFLTKHRIDRAEFDAAGLTWPELESNHDDHIGRLSELTPVANYFRDVLQQLAAVHSLKVRIKAPDHLLEKIVRKRLADAARKITVENYRQEITDLIGVRALHLFKDDWLAIHAVITKLWKRREKPVANIRQGDPTSLFREAGCKIKEHPAGYRSVHYVVRYQPTKEIQFVEIQVRTIFEEGWSEIDHRIRYPHNTGDAILSQFLTIFNGLAGSADHMGLYIKFLANEMQRIKDSNIEEQARLKAELDALRLEVSRTKLSAPDKKRITGMLDTLDAPSSSRTSSTTLSALAQARALAFAPPATSAFVDAMQEAMKQYSTTQLLQDAYKSVQAQMDSAKALERLAGYGPHSIQREMDNLFGMNRAKKK